MDRRCHALPAALNIDVLAIAARSAGAVRSTRSCYIAICIGGTGLESPRFEQGKPSMSDYHQFLPPPGTARYAGLTHRQILDSLPARRIETWKARLDSLREKPFKGITTDGQVQTGLFALRDEGAPTAAMLEAVARLVAMLTPDEAKAVLHPMDSIDRRKWVNEVPRYERYGIWLDEATPAVREAALAAGAQLFEGAMVRRAFGGPLGNASGVQAVEVTSPVGTQQIGRAHV